MSLSRADHLYTSSTQSLAAPTQLQPPRPPVSSQSRMELVKSSHRLGRFYRHCWRSCRYALVRRVEAWKDWKRDASYRFGRWKTRRISKTCAYSINTTSSPSLNTFPTVRRPLLPVAGLTAFHCLFGQVGKVYSLVRRCSSRERAVLASPHCNLHFLLGLDRSSSPVQTRSSNS